MTADETKKVLAVLKTAYPASYRGITQQEVLAIVALWADAFAEDSYADVNAAVRQMIATRVVGYTPSIGEVKQQLGTCKTAQLKAANVWDYRYGKLNELRKRLGMSALRR